METRIDRINNGRKVTKEQVAEEVLEKIRESLENEIVLPFQSFEDEEAFGTLGF